MNLDRRTFLSASVGGTVIFAGCTIPGTYIKKGNVSEPTQTTSTKTDASIPTENAPNYETDVSSGGLGVLILELTGVEPNPKGPDHKNLNNEIVRMKFNVRDRSFDLSEFTLMYYPYGLTYTFSSFVSCDIRGGTKVTVHSGHGQKRIDPSDPPEYHLFVGSNEPLLDNSGGKVTLGSKNSNDIFSELKYKATSEG